MISKTMEWVKNKIFYITWYLLHIAYQVQLEIRDYLRFNLKYIKRRLCSCFPLYSQENELKSFVETVSKIAKVPKHLAISVIPDSHETVLSMLLRKLWVSNPLFKYNSSKTDEDLNEITYNVDGVNLQALARLVAWASAANIPVISLYDYKGVLKTQFRELGCYIQEEIAQDFWAVKQARDINEPPIVKFHNVHKPNGYKNGNGFTNGNGFINGHVNGSNGTKPRENLHLFVFSNSDGKPAIIKAVKDIYLEKFNGRSGGSQIEENGNSATPPESENLSKKCVDEATLDSYLNRYNDWSPSIVEAKTEPDLLLILGNVKSTLGFLPWHIRLTEIHWLPTLERVELSDFFGSLLKYGRCQQRFGK